MEQSTLSMTPQEEPGVSGQELPLLLTVDQAAARLGIGRTKLYELVMAGEIESVPVGRLRRIPGECLEEYVTRLRESSSRGTPAA